MLLAINPWLVIAIGVALMFLLLGAAALLIVILVNKQIDKSRVEGVNLINRAGELVDFIKKQKK